MALSAIDFNMLVEDHAPALYRTAYRMLGDQHEAEDVVQDTFRSAWNSRKRFDSSRKPRAWLAAILRRRVIDRWRKTNKVKLASGDQTIDRAVEYRDPIEDGYGDEMQHALDKLPKELKESLLLVVVGELTHQEAANLLKIPLGTVLSRVSRARSRLREYFLALAENS